MIIWTSAKLIYYYKNEKTNHSLRIFGNHVSNKGFVSRIYKKLSHLDNKMTNNPIFRKMGKRSKHISKKDIRMCDKYMKRCVISFVIKKHKLKPQVSYVTYPLDSHKKYWQYQVLKRIWNIWNFHTFLVWIQNDTVTLENNLAIFLLC